MKKVLLFTLSLFTLNAFAQTADVTFKVDMNNYLGDFTEVQLNGTFNAWCGACNPMTDDDDDGVWEVTLTLDTGAIEYKFTYDSWAGQESFTEGMECTVTNDGFTNRYLHFTDDTDLGVVCYNSCDICSDPLAQIDLPIDWEGEDTDYTVTDFEGNSGSSVVADPEDAGNMVLMSTKTDGAQPWAGTTLSTPAGFANAIDFDSLNTIVTVDVYSPEANTVVRLKVEDASDPTKSVETEATVVNADSWETLSFDFSNEAAGTAAINYTYTYDKMSIFYNFGTDGATAGELSYYCDNVEFAGGGGGGGSTTADVTFKVDMNNYGGTFTEVQLNGTFNGWCGACNPMSDDDMDGVWEVTLPLDTGAIEYKFTYDNWSGQENFTEGDPCTVTNDGFTNRSLDVQNDVILDAVCWESCDPCGGSGNNADTAMVTFKVDMNDFTGDFTEVQLNGTFNGWCGACTPMSDDDADGVWEVSMYLDTGMIEYKFTYDNWAGQENLTPGSECTITVDAFTNRSLHVTQDTELAVVCWESCESCDGQSSSSNVLFKVDMNEYTGSYTNVNLNGTFNGWCGSCATMTDDDGDGVYELMVNIGHDTIEYKFTLDGWTTQEEFTEGTECTTTIDGFTNRSLVVDQEITLDAVCWNECEACEAMVGVNEVLDLASFNLFPNPARDQVTLRVDFGESLQYTLNITDLSGKVVYQVTERNNNINEEINTAGFGEGMYLLTLFTEKGYYSEKLVIHR